MAATLTPALLRRAVFWSLMLAFIAWDLHRSPAIDLWREPPLIAAGSGQVSAGGHCSMAK
jgi:hypothetical protein